MSTGKWKLLTIAAAVLLAASDALAQPPTPTQISQHPAHGAASPEPRESSGTSWLPNATPMAGFHTTLSEWQVMLHGNVFAQFLLETGSEHRRSRQFGSINWAMVMAQRPLGNGRLGLRGMVSLEPWTIRGCGYPNLLATGEVCDGDTIHDRQHPHDLFMEIAAEYDRLLAGAVRWQIYGGFAGEPALGPPGFPHRPSAMPNPVAPISHHWLDSTHITFGLVTTGLYSTRWKAEASVFNSREPDERRLDLDLAPLDSFSARLSLAPTERLAVQVSAGHLRENEAGLGAQPRQDVNRFTASAIYHRVVNERGLWATTIAYGINDEASIVPSGLMKERTHALMVETSAALNERDTWFGRLDVVGKPAHDLHAHEYITQVFPVGKLVMGYARHFAPRRGVVPGVGAHMNLSVVPDLLAPRYEGRVAPGFGVFFNLRPR